MSLLTKIKSRLWFLKSRTMRWFGIYASAAWLALPLVGDSLPQLQPYLPDNIYKWLSLVFIVLGIVMRLKTTEALGDKK
jgi:hypothetical protein